MDTFLASLMVWRKQRSGFTLIELLLVIAIIGILASIILIAINPTKQLGDARDTQRRTDVNTILDAVYQYSIDMHTLPLGIPTGTAGEVCRTGATSCVGFVDLGVLVPAYVVSIPIDPRSPVGGAGTRYFIVQGSERRITVSAPDVERASSISVTR